MAIFCLRAQDLDVASLTTEWLPIPWQSPWAGGVQIHAHGRKHNKFYVRTYKTNNTAMASSQVVDRIKAYATLLGKQLGDGDPDANINGLDNQKAKEAWMRLVDDAGKVCTEGTCSEGMCIPDEFVAKLNKDCNKSLSGFLAALPASPGPVGMVKLGKLVTALTGDTCNITCDSGGKSSLVGKTLSASIVAYPETKAKTGPYTFMEVFSKVFPGGQRLFKWDTFAADKDNTAMGTLLVDILPGWDELDGTKAPDGTPALDKYIDAVKTALVGHKCGPASAVTGNNTCADLDSTDLLEIDADVVQQDAGARKRCWCTAVYNISKVNEAMKHVFDAQKAARKEKEDQEAAVARAEEEEKARAEKEEEEARIAKATQELENARKKSEEAQALEDEAAKQESERMLKEAQDAIKEVQDAVEKEKREREEARQKEADSNKRITNMEEEVKRLINTKDVSHEQIVESVKDMAPDVDQGARDEIVGDIETSRKRKWWEHGLKWLIGGILYQKLLLMLSSSGKPAAPESTDATSENRIRTPMFW
jgi:hypothetical protein